MADNDFDMRDVLAGLDAAGKVFERYGRDVFTELGRDFRADFRDQKGNRRGVLGASWAPRSEASRERASRGGKVKRRRSAATGLLGKVPTAWRSEVDEGGLEMENMIPFAGVHHHGGTIGHGARLPARPHLDVDPRHVDDAIEALEILAVEMFEGRK